MGTREGVTIMKMRDLEKRAGNLRKIRRVRTVRKVLDKIAYPLGKPKDDGGPKPPPQNYSDWLWGGK
jgi:hypothetical protein